MNLDRELRLRRKVLEWDLGLVVDAEKQVGMYTYSRGGGVLDYKRSPPDLRHPLADIL